MLEKELKILHLERQAAGRRKNYWAWLEHLKLQNPFSLTSNKATCPNSFKSYEPSGSISIQTTAGVLPSRDARYNGGLWE